MDKFKLGQKVKGVKRNIDFATLSYNEIKHIGRIIDKTRIKSDNIIYYRLDDLNWYKEKDIQLVSKYETQKSKLNV